MRRPTRIVVWLALAAVPGFAQRDTGIITGTVRDITGAVVPQASVVVIEATTGVHAFRTTTDEAGRYTAPALKPAEYVVSVEREGFKREVRRGVVLQVNQVAVVDITLQLGQVTETVEVTEAPTLMRTESAELGEVVERKRVVDLPLNGRFFVNLVHLAPGVTPPAPVQNPNNNVFLGARAGQPGVQVNGQRPGSNNYTIDGIDNSESTVGNIILYPPIDAIQEFRVQTSNQEAEFGKNPGATINVVIRGGTNELRGNLYHFHRNDALDAKNFFDRPDQPIPPFKLNQYGATLGGPVSKNRAFFFGFYEGYKIRQAQTFVRTVPTALMRTGNLSELGRPIYDPLTYNASTGLKQRFPGDTIPAARMHPVAVRLMELQYPPPNRAGLDFVWNPKRISNSNQGGVRVDHHFTERHFLFGRFMMQNFSLDDPGVMTLPIQPSRLIGTNKLIESAHETLNVRGAVIGQTYVLSPQMVSEFRAGFTRERVYFPNPLLGTKAAEAIGIPFVNNPAVTFSGGLPSFGISGFAGLGESAIQPFIVTDNNFQYTEHFTWLRGTHRLKFGGSVIRRQFNFFQAQWQRGTFSFDGSFTSQLGVGGTGSGLADFLLGIPVSSTLAVIENPTGQRQISGGWYFQDTWRVKPRLTMIYGLRYELHTPRVEVADRQGNFDPTIPGGAVWVASAPNAPCGRALRCTDFKNFAPRFGLAYQPQSRLVVRLGYGIFYDDYAVHAFGGITTGLIVNPPFWRGQSRFNDITSPANPTFLLHHGVPPVVYVPVTDGKVFPVAGILYNAKYQNPRGRNSYVQQWNFTVERELTRDLVWAVSYVGNKGTRNMYTSNVNQAVPGPGPIAPRRPFPAWSDVLSMYMDGQSNYQGLQTKLQQRLRRGVSFLAAYTFSKSIDDAKGEFVSVQDTRNLKAERGRSDWDITHRFVMSGTFELPIGPGRRFGPQRAGVVRRLVEGWSVNPILNVATGLPFTPTLATPTANVGWGVMRPDRIGKGVLDKPTPDRWFDPGAFRSPPIFQFGNAGRNILTGPGTAQLDVNFQKDTYFSDGRDRFLQFRAEFFNLFNTPQFNNPVATIGSPAVGRILSAGDPANFSRTSRQVQLGLKFYF